jgi:hypothetical protein
MPHDYSKFTVRKESGGKFALMSANLEAAFHVPVSGAFDALLTALDDVADKKSDNRDPRRFPLVSGEKNAPKSA